MRKNIGISHLTYQKNTTNTEFHGIRKFRYGIGMDLKKSVLYTEIPRKIIYIFYTYKKFRYTDKRYGMCFFLYRSFGISKFRYRYRYGFSSYRYMVYGPIFGTSVYRNDQALGTTSVLVLLVWRHLNFHGCKSHHTSKRTRQNLHG